MHKNLDNITVIVSLLKAHNIRDIVVNPGGTNIPLIRAIQDDTFFKCYSVVDERSAVYFAIGLYLQTGRVIALSCTSAQATRNYIPGLTEAFYKRVPLLAITMSKHPRFTYQEYMQAPDQTSLPKDAVKASFALPLVYDDSSYLHCNRIVNDAILELKHHSFGPVQLNIPWQDFELDGEVNTPRTIFRTTVFEQWNLDLSGKKILLVIGEHSPFTSSLANLIEKFCECYDVAIYANHLSNYHGKYTIHANLAMSIMTNKEFAESFKPDIIISIGGQTGDYPLYHQLRKICLNNIEHWRVSIDGNVIDTYDKLTRVFECSEEFFFSSIKKQDNQNHYYYEIWKNAIEATNVDVNVPFSNVYVANKLHSILPQNSIIQFSILNSLRVWSLFPLDPSVQCFSNVAAFGIDGGMSTLLGMSMATDQLCFMVIGDLAFLYDMNALSIRGLKNNIRILLVNNNGGIEFKLHGENMRNQDRYIAAGDSFNNAKGWAETCGFEYMSASTTNEFENVRERFVSDNSKPIVLEIFVRDEDEAIAYHKLIDSNRTLSNTDLLKKTIKHGLKSFFKK